MISSASYCSLALAAKPINREHLTGSECAPERSGWDGPRVLMLIALATGAMVRLAAIGISSLWIDEFVTLWPISGTLSETLARCRYTCNTPLFLLIERASLALWGRNPFGLRFPAVVAGALAIYVAWWTVNQLWRDRRAACVAAWVVALLPSMLFHSLDGRPYALCATLGLVIVGAMGAWLQRGSPRMLLLATGATALAAHLQFIALLWIPAENLLVLGWGLSRRWDRRRWGTWLLDQAALAIATVPLVSYLMAIRHRTNSLISEPPAIWEKYIEYKTLLNSWSLLGGLAVFILATIVIGRCGRWMPSLAKAIREDISGLVCPIALSGVSTLLVAVLAEHGKVPSAPRYFLLFAPGLWCIAVWILARMPVSRWLSRMTLVIVVASLAAYSLNPFGGWQDLHVHSDWRQALLFLDAHSRPGELIAMRSGLVEASDIRFVRDPLGQSYVDCPLVPFYVQRSWNHVALPFTLFRPETREYLNTTVRDRLEQQPSFWLVNAGPIDCDYRPWVQEALGGVFVRDQEQEFLGGILSHYVRRDGRATTCHTEVGLVPELRKSS